MFMNFKNSFICNKLWDFMETEVHIVKMNYSN